MSWVHTVTKDNFFLVDLKRCAEISKESPKFCNILERVSLWRVYHVTKAVQAVLDTNMDGSNIEVVTLTHSALLHFVFHLKAAQMII